jgi:ATP-dependent DNA ligase
LRLSRNRSSEGPIATNDSVFLYAFDLIELNGDDLRRDPLQVRKATLASILAKAGPGIRFNEHIKGDGRLRPCRVTRSLINRDYSATLAAANDM